MDLKPTYKKPQFLAQIAGAFLVILCCIALPTRVGAFSLGDGLASIASFWQGVTCFFGVNCPAATLEIPSPNTQAPSNIQPSNSQYPNKNTNNTVTAGIPSANSQATNNPQNQNDQYQNENTNNSIGNSTIIQNINPTKEIQTKETQTIHTNTVTEHINTVVVDEETKNKVNLLLRQLDSDRPSYSVGQSFTLPANIGGTTLNIGSGNFTADSSGNLITYGTLTIQGNLILTNTAGITANSTVAALATSNTGSGNAITADNLTLKTNTLSTATGNLILNSSTGLIEIAGNGIKLTSSVPGDTSMALYNDSGTLKWNGSALAMGSSVSGTIGYLPKFTASNALGNSVIYESTSNVGIGTTAPTTLLHMRRADPVLTIQDTESTAANADSRLRLAESDSSGLVQAYGELQFNDAKLKFNFDNGYVPLILDRGTGNVGIGTTNPQNLIDIEVPSNGQGLLINRNSVTTNDYASLRMGVTTGNGLFEKSAIFFKRTGGNGVGDMIFSNSNDSVTSANASLADAVMTLQRGGNVGIGTTAPGARLDIVQSEQIGAATPILNIATAWNNASTTFTGILSNTTNTASASGSLLMDLQVGGVSKFKVDKTGWATLPGATFAGDIYPGSVYAGLVASVSYKPRSPGADLVFTNFAASEKMRILDSGNVGIGTTAPAYKVDAAGYGRFSSGLIAADAVIAGTSGLYYGTNGTGNYAFGSSTALGARPLALSSGNGTYTDGNINFSTAGLERVRIDGAGNVGIGTTAPAKTLSIGSSNHAQLFGTGADSAVLQSPGDVLITTDSDNNYAMNSIKFGSNGDGSSANWLMAILENGKVGIGTTAPGAKLSVHLNEANTNTVPYLNLKNDASGYVSWSLRKTGANDLTVYNDWTNDPVMTWRYQSGGGRVGIGTMAAAAKLHLVGEGYTSSTASLGIFNASSTSTFYVRDDGNVGIGTTAPTSKLMIADSTLSRIINSSGSRNIQISSYAADANYIYGAGADFLVGTVDANNIRFMANGADVMKMTSTGNVGIGTTAPQGKLDVQVNSGGENISVRFVDGGTDKAKLVFNENTSDIFSLFYDGYGVSSPNNRLNIYAEYLSSPIMTFIENGNVGIGTTAPGEKFSVDHGNVRFDWEPTPAAPTPAVNAVAGNLDGIYYYRVTFVTTAGESETGAVSVAVNPIGQQVILTSIPLGSSAVTARKIYRTTAGGSKFTSLRLVATISDNVTTSYNDNVADASLGAYAPWINSTSGIMKMGTMQYGGISTISTKFGYDALGTNTGRANSAFGAEAMDSNQTGYENSAFGYMAMDDNTTGYYNSSFGVKTLASNTTGAYNSGFGSQALIGNTSGQYNVAVGMTALNSTQTGHYNVAVGYQAGYGAAGTSFAGNSLFGYQAGIALTTGSNNIIIGRSAGDHLTSGTNNILLGYDIDAPISSGSNQLSIGNLIYGIGINGTATTTSTGNIGIGISNPAQKLHVYRSTDGAPVRFEDANGYCEIDPTTTTWTCTSDINMKKDIVPLSPLDTLEKITSMRGVNFRWKTQNDNTLRYGFIAQEVEKIFPEFVSTDEKGLKSVAYGAFTPVMVEAIKYQQKEIDDLKLILSPEGAVSDASSTQDLGTGEGIAGWLANGLRSLGLALQDGVASLKEVVAEKINFNQIAGNDADINKIETKQICVVGTDGEEVCLTKDQLKELLQNTGASATYNKNYDEPRAPATTTQEVNLPPESGESATSTGQN